MKRKSFVNKILLTLVACLTFEALFANPAGNACDVVFFEEGIFAEGKSDTSLRLGYIGDFIVDRKQQVRNQKQLQTEIAQRDFNGVECTLNLYNRFDFMGRLGYANCNTRWSVGQNSDLRLATRDDFAWAFGAKAMINQWEKTTLSISGSYMWGNAKVERAETTGVGFTPIGQQYVLNQNVHQREKKWNFGATIGHQIENLMPYIGLQYIQDKTYFKENITLANQVVSLPNFSSRKKVGTVVGIGLAAGKKATLNLEGRFLNESALTLTGQARF